MKFAYEIKYNLKLDPDKIRHEISAALYQFGQEVLTASQEVVPMDDGALLNSGHCDTPVDDGNEISVTVGYGGTAAPYALYVHEALEGPHPIDPNWSWAKAAKAGKSIQWSRPGSGPKYLENPLKERQNQLPARIAEAVRRGMGK